MNTSDSLDQKHPDYYEFVYRTLTAYISNSDEDFASAADIVDRSNLTYDGINQAYHFLTALTERYKEDFVKSLEEFAIEQENP